MPFERRHHVLAALPRFLNRAPYPGRIMDARKKPLKRPLPVWMLDRWNSRKDGEGRAQSVAVRGPALAALARMSCNDGPVIY
ncbi:MAG: hypothetical protein ACXWLC_11035 [Rhizomicrobium sp.]